MSLSHPHLISATAALARASCLRRLRGDLVVHEHRARALIRLVSGRALPLICRTQARIRRLLYPLGTVWSASLHGFHQPPAPPASLVTGRPLPRTSTPTRQGRSRFTRGDTPARRDNQPALLAHPDPRVDLCLAQPDKGGLTHTSPRRVAHRRAAIVALKSSLKSLRYVYPPEVRGHETWERKRPKPVQTCVPHVLATCGATPYWCA